MTITDAVRNDLTIWTVDDICHLLSVDRSWVYRHAHELGGFKVGKLLRFHDARVRAWVGSQ